MEVCTASAGLCMYLVLVHIAPCISPAELSKEADEFTQGIEESTTESTFAPEGVSETINYYDPLVHGLMWIAGLVIVCLLIVFKIKGDDFGRVEEKRMHEHDKKMKEKKAEKTNPNYTEEEIVKQHKIHSSSPPPTPSTSAYQAEKVI